MGHAGDTVKPAKLRQWLGVIVDPDIDLRIGLIQHDFDGGGLLAALVSTDTLTGVERRQKSLAQRQAFGSEETLQRGLHHLRASQHVAGDRDALAAHCSGPGDAVRSGVLSDAAGGIKDVQLPARLPRISRDKPVQGLIGAHVLRQERQSIDTEQGVGGGLGRQGALTGQDMRTERANRKSAGGDGDAKGTGLGIMRENGPGHCFTGRIFSIAAVTRLELGGVTVENQSTIRPSGAIRYL